MSVVHWNGVEAPLLYSRRPRPSQMDWVAVEEKRKEECDAPGNGHDKESHGYDGENGASEDATIEEEDGNLDESQRGKGNEREIKEPLDESILELLFCFCPVYERWTHLLVDIDHFYEILCRSSILIQFRIFAQSAIDGD